MNRLITLLSLCILTLITSCDYSDSDTRIHPSVETLGVSVTSDNEFNLEGRITQRSDLSVIDHGFIWNLSEKVKPGFYDQISLGKLVSESFSAQANYGFGTSFDYYIRAYAKTKKEVVYGNAIIVKAKNGIKPIVEGFTPTTGVPGDTITIYGKYLSANNALSDINIVYSSNFPIDYPINLPIINGNNSSIQVHAASSGNLSLNYNTSFVWESIEPFTLLIPSYSDYYPKSGSGCDIITVGGKNFGNGVDFNEISINGEPAVLLSATKSKIQFYVPVITSGGNPTGGTSSIKHKIGPKINHYPFYVNLPSTPIFTSLSSTKVSRGDTLIINGSNIPFCSEESILVFLNDYGFTTTLKKISISNNQIIVQIPKESHAGQYSLLVQVLQWKFPFDFEIE